MRFTSALVCFLLLFACKNPNTELEVDSQEVEVAKSPWAIVIHGGAGVISKDITDSVRLEYERALQEVLDAGVQMLKDSAEAMDVVEAVINRMEDDPHFNAGKGAVLNARGQHELDASIMDGRDLSCGAVASVHNTRHPISLARKVMLETNHVLLSSSGADEFSIEVGEEQVDNSWFTTERRKAQWESRQEKNKASAQVEVEIDSKINKYGTVGCVVLDLKGNLAAGTSTGGMTGKKYGRVGDSPIIGAGTYANNASCALSATGTGEEFIRHGVCRDISSRMLYQGVSLNAAADSVVHGTLKEGDGGIIGVSKHGEIAMTYNSLGMFRGCANAEGRYEVLIWEAE